MKSKLIKILLLVVLFFPTSGYADSSGYEQNESVSPTHELPRADQCSVLTIHIRDLAYSLKKVVKEISLLETENNGHYEQQKHKNEQRLALLHEKVSSLRKQIDLQEQQLENCGRHQKEIQEQ